METGSAAEVRRWVFDRPCEGLTELGREVTEPRHFLKLCGSGETLRAALPPRWQLLPPSHFMIAGTARWEAPLMPEGYVLHPSRQGDVASVVVTAPDGSLAASGHAAEASGAFVYDRIETALEHRRRGLGSIVLSVLASFRSSAAIPQLLVATEDGRALYARLGWTMLSPYSTAVIPA